MSANKRLKKPESTTPTQTLSSSGKKVVQQSMKSFFAPRPAQAPPSPTTPSGSTPSPTVKEEEEEDDDVSVRFVMATSSSTGKGTPQSASTPAPTAVASVNRSGKNGKSTNETKSQQPKKRKQDDSDNDPDFVEDADGSLSGTDSESEGEPEVESDVNSLADEDSENEFKTPQKRKRGAETGGGQSRKRSALASSSRSAIGNSGKKAPASKSKGTAKKSTALKSGKANNDAAEEDDEENDDGDGEEGEVVGKHAHESLSWLEPEKIRDKSGVLHKDLLAKGITPRTLRIPADFRAKASPAQKQWLEFKEDNFDCLLFMKVGKFYELYHWDADVGVREAGLTYMRGEVAHCGFPERSFSYYANQLVAKGYKVIRVEQMLTPLQLKQSNNVDKKTIPREIVRIHTPGTMSMSTLECETEMGLVDRRINRDASCLLVICEKFRVESGTEKYEYGICLLYPGPGTFLVGQFTEDRYHSRLRTLLAQHTPNEILLERGAVSSKLNKVLMTNADHAKKDLLQSQTEFYDARRTIEVLLEREYFGPALTPQWPPALAGMFDLGGSLPSCKPEYQLAIRALGGSTWYLKRCEIDLDVIPLKNFQLYLPADQNLAVGNSGVVQRIVQPKHMVLDGVTLQHLDIIPSSLSNANACLLFKINRCMTKFGARLLKDWIMKPLFRIPDILDRQNAIADLTVFQRENDKLHKSTLACLKGLPDLERLLSKVHIVGSLQRKKIHPEARAVMFDDVVYSKRKIKDFLATIRAFSGIIELVRRIGKSFANSSSPTLRSIVTLVDDASVSGGAFPCLAPVLEHFLKSFDEKQAEEDGLIKPRPGMDQEYDDAIAAVEKVKDWFEQHRVEQSRKFKCKITYFGSGKHQYQLEMPESACGRMPEEYELKSQKKGFKRYWSAEIPGKLVDLESTEARRQAAVKDCTRRVFEKFDHHYAEWKTAVSCMSTLDVLLALEEYSSNLAQSCVPTFKEATENQPPYIAIRDGHHPLVYKTYSGGDFIPNDAFLGIREPDDASYNGCLTLLTGPNMGGKSTLMRQIGLITVLAQLGSNVPAKFCELTPVDRIFTRIGASDNLLAGESTFYVELAETSAIIQHATQHSLVLVDELGRGTATFDGTAVAAAVLKDLATRIKCRTLFSTHYHSLVERFRDNSNVKLGHMACLVENENEDDPTQESITFLYKFIRGACPKSYGFNAAKLAGLPDSIIQRAHAQAQKLEKLMEIGKLKMQG